jgi:hypothetical protein
MTLIVRPDFSVLKLRIFLIVLLVAKYYNAKSTSYVDVSWRLWNTGR